MPFVSPPPPTSPNGVYYAVGVSSFLLLIGAFFYRRHLQRAAEKLNMVELEMVGQIADFGEQKKALEAKKEKDGGGGGGGSCMGS